MEQKSKKNSVKTQFLLMALFITTTLIIALLAILFVRPNENTPTDPTSGTFTETDATYPTQEHTVNPTDPSTVTTDPHPTVSVNIPETTAPKIEESVDWDQKLNFQPVDEFVTAKERTNLRDIPAQGEDSTVLYTLVNGEIAKRVAISDYGWSKLEYNGKSYYAVSSYLTTDLTPPPYEIQTQFTDLYEFVTAKDVVNLRSLPSVTHAECEVIAQLHHGEVILRTGVNDDLGWSRVEYNGQVLYCISQYLMPAEDEPDDPSPAPETTDLTQ